MFLWFPISLTKRILCQFGFLDDIRVFIPTHKPIYKTFEPAAKFTVI